MLKSVLQAAWPRFTALALATTFAASIVGCEQKSNTSANSAAPSSSGSSSAKEGQPLKVAFVYIGPVGSAGWTYAHDLARKDLEKQYGDKIKTSFVESVPDGADAERVFRDLASQGNQLIFGTTFGYGEAMLKVAKAYPDVKFEHATGYKNATNMNFYDSRTYEGAYLAGIIAGKMSKSNKLGVVASIPIPEVIRNINAFTLGAQSVNPKISTSAVWVNKWFDPGKEREAALALIGQGVDVLIQNTDSPAPIQAAEEKGVMAFGWDSDMSQHGAKAHLGSAAINWTPYYSKVVADVLAGTWKQGDAWWGVKEGAIGLVSPNASLPAEVKTLLEQKTAAIKEGKLHPFQGPIVNQEGKEVLATGQSMSDKDLRAMTYYVKGVEGSIPK